MCNEPGVNYAIKAAAQGKASFARRGAALRVFFLPLLFVASRAARSAGGGELVVGLSCSCTVAVFLLLLLLLLAPWMTASLRSRVVVRCSRRQGAPHTQADVPHQLAVSWPDGTHAGSTLCPEQRCLVGRCLYHCCYLLFRLPPPPPPFPSQHSAAVAMVEVVMTVHSPKWQC